MFKNFMIYLSLPKIILFSNLKFERFLIHYIFLSIAAYSKVELLPVCVRLVRNLRLNFALSKYLRINLLSNERTINLNGAHNNYHSRLFSNNNLNYSSTCNASDLNTYM